MHIHKDATVEFTMTEYTFLKSDDEDVVVTVRTTATVIGTLSRSVTVVILNDIGEHLHTLEFSTSEFEYSELTFAHSINRVEIQTITLTLNTTDPLVELGSNNTVSIVGELVLTYYMSY